MPASAGNCSAGNREPLKASGKEGELAACVSCNYCKVVFVLGDNS